MLDPPPNRLPARKPPQERRCARLLLRAWRESDLPAFARMNADPEAMQYFPALLSRAESDALATRIQASFAQHGFGPWALELPSEEAFLGCVGLARPSFEAHFTPCVEIVWRIAREYWGKGYALEAARAALDTAFVHLGLEQVVSFTAVHNARSRRVMEALGMHHDPRDDFDHPLLPSDHVLCRHVLYRIARGRSLA